MKTIKVSEATELQLDWLVAKCEGGWTLATMSFILHHRLGRMDFSTDWAQGGPIIEREEIGIQVEYADGEATGWVADSMRYCCDEDEQSLQFGSTPLIAAMRCYVASKLGHTAEVPEELT